MATEALTADEIDDLARNDALPEDAPATDLNRTGGSVEATTGEQGFAAIRRRTHCGDRGGKHTRNHAGHLRTDRSLSRDPVPRRSLCGSAPGHRKRSFFVGSYGGRQSVEAVARLVQASTPSLDVYARVEDKCA